MCVWASLQYEIITYFIIMFQGKILLRQIMFPQSTAITEIIHKKHADTFRGVVG